jgi:hypothetical protein
LVLFRYRRELEPPEADEGFASLETVPFVRRPHPERDRAATVFTLDTLDAARPEDAVEGRFLVLGWATAAPATPPPGAVDLVLCTHGGGPPRCWCRPPLPGALVRFARRYRLDPSRSSLWGATPAHRALAAAAGFQYHHRPH